MRCLLVGLAQTDQLSEIQRSVRDRFQEGGSFWGVLLALGIVLMIVMVAWWLTTRAERRGQSTRPSDPTALFDETIDGLGLGPTEARLLKELRRHAALGHPTVLLLSREAFDRSVLACFGTTSGEISPEQEIVIEPLRVSLFGTPAPEPNRAIQ
jgi:hypothetical protein